MWVMRGSSVCNAQSWVHSHVKATAKGKGVHVCVCVRACVRACVRVCVCVCQTHPPGGPHKRWKDQIWKDLKSLGVLETKWYDEANHSRDEWCAIYCEGLQANLNHHQQRQGEEVLTQSQDRVWCQLCQRSFRRESDRKRHKFQW